MEKVIKIKDDLLKTSKDIQSKYQSIAFALGRIKMHQADLESQENDLLKEFNDIKSLEKTFLELLSKEYGQGVLNTDTGEFVPE